MKYEIQLILLVSVLSILWIKWPGFGFWFLVKTRDSHVLLFTQSQVVRKPIDPLHKWRLHLNNNTYTSLASHSCEKSFVLKHEYEAKDVSSIVIQI